LLHVAGSLDTPTQGRVFYAGEDVYAMKETRRAALRSKKLGFVFQSYHLLPELTVLENVVLPSLSTWGGLRRHKATRQRAESLLSQVGLGDRLLHRPMELSGGEQQRAALARALINDPDVVLADEPTGNLDSKTGEVVLDLLFHLVQERLRTLVLVTHNREVAARCDRNLVLQDGRLE
jgi:predicted ABC-type transport system involved in lysophospholipase L1 biosynthesis ATPase subunit